ncbi:putative major facilitator, sugar transporter [Medicago truncatula]|uniref:Putative major facilitator, sugar transporter n=1 Tax=Medicago truncatula TaxID=3880 RepID=A0A396JWA9_MEDTR|nr:putative major facilitator, sugar transporter [Medicago truncatula]
MYFFVHLFISMPNPSILYSNVKKLLTPFVCEKVLFLEGGGQMFICQIAIGTMIALKFGESGEGSLTKGEAELLLFFISAYVAAFAGSWGPLGWSDQVKFVLLRFDLQVKLSMLP